MLVIDADAETVSSVATDHVEWMGPDEFKVDDGANGHTHYAHYSYGLWTGIARVGTTR